MVSYFDNIDTVYGKVVIYRTPTSHQKITYIMIFKYYEHKELSLKGYHHSELNYTAILSNGNFEIFTVSRFSKSVFIREKNFAQNNVLTRHKI